MNLICCLLVADCFTLICTLGVHKEMMIGPAIHLLKSISYAISGLNTPPGMNPLYLLCCFSASKPTFGLSIQEGSPEQMIWSELGLDIAEFGILFLPGCRSYLLRVLLVGRLPLLCKFVPLQINKNSHYGRIEDWRRPAKLQTRLYQKFSSSDRPLSTKDT